MWYVGLDWADTHHDVDVIDEHGHRVGAQRFAHSLEGLNKLKAWLLQIAKDPEQLACIVETTHGLLITFLLEAGIPVYPVNPKMANQLRKTAGAKTDPIDAHLLAKMGRFEWEELRRLEPDSPTVAELKTLTRDQDALIQTQTRLVNQLTACLKEYYPAAYQHASGQLWLSLSGTTLTVTLAVRQLVPNSRHMEHIHLGRCERQGPIVFQLPTFVADKNGNVTLTTPIHNVTHIPPGSWYVNIHRTDVLLVNSTNFDPILCSNIDADGRHLA